MSVQCDVYLFSVYVLSVLSLHSGSGSGSIKSTGMLRCVTMQQQWRAYGDVILC
jgi:hypothetical protein